MANEYFPIILDIGSRFLRLGYVGESIPTVTIPTTSNFTSYNNFNTNTSNNPNCNLPKYLDTNDTSLTPADLELINGRLFESPHYKKLSEIYTQDLINFKWINLQEDLSNRDKSCSLIMKFKRIFSDEILIPPIKVKIILINPNNSVSLNYQILNFLLFDLRVKSVILLNESIMNLVGSNLSSGLVVQLGWKQATIDPIIDLRKLDELSYENEKKFNGYTLHYKIIESLINLNDSKVNDLLLSRLDVFDIIELFIVNAVYVRLKDDKTCTVSEYTILPEVTIPGSLRYEIIEKMLFDENDENSLPKVIVNIIKKSAVDIRCQLSENIIICGGLSKIAGLKTRLLQEIRILDHFEVEGKLTVGSWCGTSLYCANNLFRQSRSIIRNQEITRDVLRENTSEKGILLSALPDNWNLLNRLDKQ